MKSTFALLFSIASIYSFGQCSEFFSVSKDKFADRSTITLKEPLTFAATDSTAAFGINLIKEVGAKDFYLTIVVDGACLKESAKIRFAFTDGGNHMVYSSYKRNCEGTAFVPLGNMMAMKKSYNTLSSKLIDAVSVETINGNKYIEFDETLAARVKEMIICLNGM